MNAVDYGIILLYFGIVIGLGCWYKKRASKNLESYFLAGKNMRYVEAWRLFARVAGRRGPLCPAGPLMRIIAGRWGDLRTRVTGREGEAEITDSPRRSPRRM